MSPSAPFRFDAANHEYWDLVTGAQLPSITQMLLQTGWVDDRWYTDAARNRGTAVHRLCADYDLGALDVAQLRVVIPPVPYLGYLLAHVKAMQILQPEILEIEQTHVHAVHRYAGRLDRVLKVHNLVSVLEEKSGQPEAAHAIQTALQAILVADEYDLPAEMFGRYALYLKHNGRFRLMPHDKLSDFDEARKVIRQCCNGF